MTFPTDYASAVSYRAEVATLFREYKRSEFNNDSIAEKIRATVQPGLYRHFKSRPDDCRYYVVHNVDFQQTTHTPMVYYASLYGLRAGLITSRRLIYKTDGFLTPVDKGGYKGPRFELMSYLSLPAVHLVLEYSSRLADIRYEEEFTSRLRQILHR